MQRPTPHQQSLQKALVMPSTTASSPAYLASVAELSRAQADAQAFSADARALVAAQRDQIAELERQRASISTALEGEQRLFANLAVRPAQALRMRQELKTLAADLDTDSRRAAAVSAKMEEARQDVQKLQQQLNDVGSNQQRTRAAAKRTGSLKAKLQRTQTACDEATIANSELVAEIDSLRRERQLFESKLQALQIESADHAWASVLAGEATRHAAAKREDAERATRELEERGLQRARRHQADAEQLVHKLKVAERQRVQAGGRGRDTVAASLAAASNPAAAVRMQQQRMLAGSSRVKSTSDAFTWMRALLGLRDASDAELASHFITEEKERRKLSAQLEQVRAQVRSERAEHERLVHDQAQSDRALRRSEEKRARLQAAAQAREREVTRAQRGHAEAEVVLATLWENGAQLWRDLGGGAVVATPAPAPTPSSSPSPSLSPATGGGAVPATSAALFRRVHSCEVKAKEVRDDADAADAWQPLCSYTCSTELPGRLELQLLWRDQGWGDKKGRVRALLRAGQARGRFAQGEVMHAADCFGVCGEHGSRFAFSRVDKAFERDSPLLALAAPGDSIEVECAGGGQELHIKDFVLHASVPIDSLPELLDAIENRLREQSR